VALEGIAKRPSIELSNQGISNNNPVQDNSLIKVKGCQD